MLRRFVIAVSALATLSIGATDASAAWRGGYHGGYYHGGYHGGYYGGYGWGGVGAGLLAGALIGGALARPYNYGPYYDYGYAYAPYDYGYAYAPGPTYYAPRYRYYYPGDTNAHNSTASPGAGNYVPNFNGK